MNREIKEVRIDGEDSDWYSYAKFVLKPHVTQRQLPDNLIEYADHLIEKHLKLNPVKGYGMYATEHMFKKKELTSKALDRRINQFLLISTIALIGAVVFYFIY